MRSLCSRLLIACSSLVCSRFLFANPVSGSYSATLRSFSWAIRLSVTSAKVAKKPADLPSPKNRGRTFSSTQCTIPNGDTKRVSILKSPPLCTACRNAFNTKLSSSRWSESTQPSPAVSSAVKPDSSLQLSLEKVHFHSLSTFKIPTGTSWVSALSCSCIRLYCLLALRASPETCNIVYCSPPKVSLNKLTSTLTTLPSLRVSSWAHLEGLTTLLRFAWT